MLAAALFAVAFVPGTYVDRPISGDGSTMRIDGPVITQWDADGAKSATVPLADVVIDERAYLPASGWVPEPPDTLRRQAVAGGVLLTALVIVALMLPRRRVLAVVGVVTLGTAVIVAWSATRPTVRAMTGTIWLDGRADTWTWYRSPTDTVLMLPADRQTFLIAYDRRHLATLAPVLHVDAVGRMESLELTMPADVTAAVVRVGEGEPEPGTGRSPLRTMARQLYQRPGVEIVAEGERGVVLETRQTRP
ncbi:MAG: hypothetical protein AAGD32_02095 [Planctomycetota bacterium]